MGASGITLLPDVWIASLTLAHAEDMVAWMQNPHVRENVGVRNEPSLERTIAWITNANQSADCRPFAVIHAGTYVGNVILDRIDRYIGSARLSAYIGAMESRGRGIGSTGIYRAMEVAFHDLRLHKIWLTVHSQNHAALNTYTRLGFVIEGVLRDEFWLKGTRINAFYMGLLAADFEKVQVTP